MDRDLTLTHRRAEGSRPRPSAESWIRPKRWGAGLDAATSGARRATSIESLAERAWERQLVRQKGQADPARPRMDEAEHCPAHRDYLRRVRENTCLARLRCAPAAGRRSSRDWRLVRRQNDHHPIAHCLSRNGSALTPIVAAARILNMTCRILRRRLHLMSRGHRRTMLCVAGWPL